MEQKLDYEPAMEVATADLVIPLLQNNLGVGFIPEPLAAPFFEDQSLVPLSLNVPLPSRAITGEKRPESERRCRYLLRLFTQSLNSFIDDCFIQHFCF